MSQTENTVENSPEASEEQIRKIYAKDLKNGEVVHTVFRAIDKERHTSRAGKTYLSLTLVDKTGQVDGRVFDNVEAAEGAFAANDYLLVRGKIGQFHGKKQIVIERLERLDPEPIVAAEFEYTPPPAEAAVATASAGASGAAGTSAPRPEKNHEKPEKHAEKSGSHKEARARLMKMLDDPKLCMAIDTLVQYFEHTVEERMARGQHGSAPNREPREKHKGPKVEHRQRVAENNEAKPEGKRDSSLPEGLAFKPLTTLVGGSSSN